MTFTDPLADMLTRIRNANLAGNTETKIPASRQKRDVLAVFKKEKFITDFREDAEGKFSTFIVTLNPERRGMTLRRVSKPGLRVYRSRKEFLPIRGGRGIAVVSTPKGVMSHKEAIRQNVGGEVICEAY